MAMMKRILGIVVLFTVSVWTEAAVLRKSLKNALSVSEILERANKHLSDNGFIMDGDIAVPRRVRRNADPCVNTGCKWPRATDGKVYVPYTLSSSFTDNTRKVIKQAMDSFSQSTCIRFYSRYYYESDYLNIQPLNGCWSNIGRQGGSQTLSLAQPACIDFGTVQHELLHALGFHHEQKRSDRDWYIRVLWDNIKTGMKGQFEKTNTLNQNTPYDYNSVMHYHSMGFSQNQKPTLEMVPRPAREFGTATKMSQSDIDRVNRVYCVSTSRKTHTTY